MTYDKFICKIIALLLILMFSKFPDDISWSEGWLKLVFNFFNLNRDKYKKEISKKIESYKTKKKK